MRILLGGIVAAALAFSQAPPVHQAPAPIRVEGPRTGATSLTGRVMTGTGPDARPVRRARVTLLGPASRIADTDIKGAYRFDGLSAGEYKLTVQKPGFVKLEADAAPGATLTMDRAGAIEGIVTDAAGDPVMNVVVAALQPQPGGAKAKLIAQARTDDLGSYRLHSLAAGDYLVEASTDPTVLQSVFLMAGEKRPESNRAYYPAGAGTIEQGKPVRVALARDTSGIDLMFSPAPPVKDPTATPPAPRPDQTGTARIAGRVVDATSSKPIKAARILLLPIEGQRLTNWTRSDSQGRFEYTALQARRYTLSVDADRFVSMEFGQKRPGETGTQIRLVDGQDFRADVSLPRASAIEGALLDEFGDPAPNVSVQLARREYVLGQYRLIPGQQRAVVTDDRGRYRISGVSPANYYVVALSGAYTEANEVGGFAPTYYPGTTDSGGATAVTVSLGADTTGTTFALSPAKTLSISGTMIDADGRPVSGRGSLWLSTPDRLKRMDFNLARAVTTADGHFVLRNVPQGIYTMQGFGPPPPGYRGPGNLGAMPFGWLPLSVGDVDLDGVVLKVTNGTSLRGKVVLDDTAAPPPVAQQVRVSAQPVEFDSAPVGGGPPPSETRDDLTFEVSKLSGLRQIMVSVSSPDWALKRIALDGRDVTDTPVDLRTKDVEGVEVVLTPKVSDVKGTVSDDRGVVADYAVVIFAVDPTKWVNRSRFVVMTRPTQEGRFQLRLPPEDYLAVALPSVGQYEWTDPAFLQQLRPLATSFVLQEGESKSLELKLKKRP